MYPAAKITATIDEDYSINASTTILKDKIGVPLGDFLGPNVVMWSDDANIHILSGKTLRKMPPSSEGNRNIAVLIANPPFSIRVSCIPLDWDVLSLYQDKIEEEKESGEDYLTGLAFIEQDSGTIHVSIPDVEEEAEVFAEIYAHMKENDVIRVPNIPGDFVRVDATNNEESGSLHSLRSMVFRYPPIPPNSGFNVFGEFRSIKFKSATGNLLMGSRSIDINAPSSLELRDMHSLHIEGGVIQVPIRWSTRETHADIHLETNAQVYLNDEPLSKGFDAYRIWIEYALLICSLLSTIFAFIQVRSAPIHIGAHYGKGSTTK